MAATYSHVGMPDRETELEAIRDLRSFARACKCRVYQLANGKFKAKVLTRIRPHFVGGRLLHGRGGVAGNRAKAASTAHPGIYVRRLGVWKKVVPEQG